MRVLNSSEEDSSSEVESEPEACNTSCEGEAKVEGLKDFEGGDSEEGKYETCDSGQLTLFILNSFFFFIIFRDIT